MISPKDSLIISSMPHCTSKSTLTLSKVLIPPLSSSLFSSLLLPFSPLLLFCLFFSLIWYMMVLVTTQSPLVNLLQRPLWSDVPPELRSDEAQSVIGECLDQNQIEKLFTKGITFFSFSPSLSFSHPLHSFLIYMLRITFWRCWNLFGIGDDESRLFPFGLATAVQRLYPQLDRRQGH